MKAETVIALRPRYGLNALLKVVQLPRSTFYDRIQRNQKPDKYKDVKSFIDHQFHNSYRTYGYRRIHKLTSLSGFPYCEETIRKLMTDLGLKSCVYSRHTAKYSSYRGRVGKTAPNLLNQHFDAKDPLTTMHTDITQVRLATSRWAYISTVTDEASGAVLSEDASLSPTLMLVHNTIAAVNDNWNVPKGAIMHSDQGWQYQMPSYRDDLKKFGITQSMSRKGNCHDNAPIESFFSLLKREYLNRALSSMTSLKQLREGLAKYVAWYNNERISLNKDGMTPVEYITGHSGK